jgi:hypothetical protein
MNFVINNLEERDNIIGNGKQDEINKTADGTYFRI